MTRSGLLLVSTLIVAAAGPALAQGTPKRIRGAVQSLEGNTLTVTANGGETETIVLAPEVGVTAIMPTTLDKVKPGTKIGVVGFGPLAQQRAAVISIFPDGATVNEAQFAWDSAPDSTMTNAPVTSDVVSADGRILQVSVKGETVQVSVPPGAIVQESEPGTKGMLKPGAHVLIAALQAADGTISAARVGVGKDGYTPAN